MIQTCRLTGVQFEVSGDDLQFYERVSPVFSGKRHALPAPSLSPEERQRARMAFRNESTLYKRNCDLCRKNIIALYPAGTSFPVYCAECFWSDRWDSGAYGQEFDFSKSFFAQFSELLQKVPRLAIVNKQSENSAYCNYSFANKNCYLTFGNHYEEDCLYGRYSTKNKDCLDYFWLYASELSYECTYSNKCYHSIYLDHSEECTDCAFSVDLKGCRDCLFCSNLRQKQYHILNTPYSKEEYFAKLNSYELQKAKKFAEARDFFTGSFRQTFPFRAIYQINCQNSTGNNLENCKNVRQCFDATNCEDIAYASQIDETYSSMDMTCMGYDRSEACYQTIGCSGLFHGLFCDSCWDASEVLYSNLCFSSQNLFGCVSLHHKKYNILNQSYSKEEYEVLVPKIIEHMRKSAEWGKFFPANMSPFAYNETIAQEYFPLTKSEVLKKGWKWKEEEEPDFSHVTKKIPAGKLPDDITAIPDDILNWAIECAESKKLFQIQKAELDFYRQINLPIPRYHPEIRHKYRIKLRNPRQLWDRNCMKCQKTIQTIYASDRPEIIYCEECYLKTVY